MSYVLSYDQQDLPTRWRRGRFVYKMSAWEFCPQDGDVSESCTHKMAAWEICLQDGGNAAFLTVLPTRRRQQTKRKQKQRRISFLRLHLVNVTWSGEHMIMLKVTWQCFDQSAKQLIVGHTTTNTDSQQGRPTFTVLLCHPWHVLSHQAMWQCKSVTILHIYTHQMYNRQFYSHTQ